MAQNNLKGGVGKTALAVNMAAYFGSTGIKTLLIDLDPQTNATFSCVTVDKWKDHARDRGTVADILGARKHVNAQAKQKKISEVVLENVFPNVDLIPSHLDLFTIDLDLASATAREFRLRKAIAEIGEKYQLIVCDCPPNLTIPTQNAIAASTHYVVPISADFLSSLGIGILLSRIDQLCEDLAHNLILAGVVISRVGRPAHHRSEIVTALRTQFPDNVLTSTISERVAVAEAASKQISVFQNTDPQATQEFKSVYMELKNKIGV